MVFGNAQILDRADFTKCSSTHILQHIDGEKNKLFQVKAQVICKISPMLN